MSRQGQTSMLVYFYSLLRRKRQSILLLAMTAATGVILLACIAPGPLGPGLGPRECAGFSVSMNTRVARKASPNTPNNGLVGVPYAKIELISTQTKFNCPNASSGGRIVYVTNEEGQLKGGVWQAIEDRFRLTITAEGCQPLVYGGTIRGLESGDFVLNCDSPVTTPLPSPTPPAECKTIEAEVDWRIRVNGEPFEGFALVAQIDVSSVKNMFVCTDGYPLQALSFATDRFGDAVKISGHAEDVVRVRINAPGCQPFEEEVPLATLLASNQMYTLACDLSQLTPRPTIAPPPTLTPSPTPQ
jgi:hypothetical protein